METSVQVQSQVQVRVDFASDAASSSSSKETLPLSDQWLHPPSGAAPAADSGAPVDWRSVCVALEHNFHLNVPSDDHLASYQTRMGSRSAEHLNVQSARRESSPSGGRNRSQKCAHHHRSQSVRSAKRPNHYLSPPPPPSRPRGTSLPGAGAGPGGGGSDDDYYLLRQFVVSGKNKVVNRGDSFRNRRARESSGNSSASSISTENVAGSPPMTAAAGDWFSSSARPSSASHLQVRGQAGAPLRVLILGASGVGKTALTAQFMTSEYLNTYEASLDEDSCARSVSVLLDGEESELIFIDHPHGEISVENCISTYSPQAYVVVYSVVDADSFSAAEDLLHFLWRCDVISTHAVILVGNKIDLVRSRCISGQVGKSLAASFDCKFIETSSGMQHNVDELLVGILKQIRLKMSDPEQARSVFRKRSSRRNRGAGGGSAGGSSGVRSTSLRVRGFLGKVWCADRGKSRSCEDLHVL